MEISFKNWLEIATPPGARPEDVDPNLNMAARKAKAAVAQAITQKKNPIQAAQQAVATANVPVNKLGKIMPTSDDDQNAR